MIKTISISILIISAIICGAVILLDNNANTASSQNSNNVSIVNGKQIIAINAKGGYAPKVTTAKAGIPTVIKIITNGTFDCSSALTIPSLGYRQNLPPSGETEIEVPSQSSGATIQGICSMGMYHFSVNFN